MTVRTRFAPSPTGNLHLGNVRAAAFNWLLARQGEGAFILRIEDTDVVRNVEGGEASILEDLQWLGLDWDEGPDIGGAHGPYRQSERNRAYSEAVDVLLSEGAAYPCFCTEEELEGEAEEYGEGQTALRYSGRCRSLSADERVARLDAGEPHVIRFAVPERLGNIDLEDEVFGDISFPANDIDDFVLRRTDGRVTYNFAVVVDDIGMEITHVVRGVGHLSNTPKQVLLFDALRSPCPVFAHLPTVLGPDGRKLSKRMGAAAVSELRHQGYPPDAVLNYLSLLGWSHPEEKEVLTRSELIASIGLDRVGKSDTQVDLEKLRWVSSQHLAMEDLGDLTEHVRPFVDTGRFPLATENLEAVVDTLRTRLSTYADINEHLGLIYPSDAEAEPKRKAVGSDPEARRVVEAVERALGQTEVWEPAAVDQLLRATGAEIGVKGAGLFHPVRIALIGSEKGPDIGKLLAAIGKEETFRRFRQTLA